LQPSFEHLGPRPFQNRFRSGTVTCTSAVAVRAPAPANGLQVRPRGRTPAAVVEAHRDAGHWLLDGTRLAQLAADNRIGRSTAYRYLHEGIDVLAGSPRSPQANG
jgi:hypothetical protein